MSRFKIILPIHLQGNGYISAVIPAERRSAKVTTRTLVGAKIDNAEVQSSLSSIYPNLGPSQVMSKTSPRSELFGSSAEVLVPVSFMRIGTLLSSNKGNVAAGPFKREGFL